MKVLRILLLTVLFFSNEVFSQSIEDIISETKLKFQRESKTELKAKLSADLAWYYVQVNIDSAKFYGEKSLNLSKSTKNQALIAQSYNDLATVYFVKGDYKKSLLLVDEGLKLRKLLNDEAGMASLYFKKGNAYNKMSKYDSTMYYYFKANKYYEKVGDSAVFMNLESNISSTYFSMGNYSKALKYLSKPLKYYKNTKQFLLLSNSTMNLGNIQLSLKDTINALQSFNKAIDYAEQSNNYSTLAATYNNMANIYTAQNKFDLASEFIEKSIEIREKMGLDADLESSKLTLANNELRIGNYFEAKKRYLNVKNVFERNNAKDKLKEIYLGLSFIYASEKNTDSLNFYHKKYVEILSTIYKDETLKASQEIEVKYQTEKKEREILVQKAKIAEKNTIIISVISLLLLSVLLGYFLYSKQKMKTLQLIKERELQDALLKIETQNKLQEQRLQISRDLHDNIGSQLTFIISSIDNLKFALGNQNPKVDEKLTKISSFTRETIVELRDTIWAMNKEEITVEDLETRISNFIENAKISLIGTQFNFVSNLNSTDLKPFSSRDGMNIYRIIQESVNNAIKHGNASKIEVSIQEVNKRILVEIRDNGSGFNIQEVENGNGLNSIHKRATELHANIDMVSNENGTSIKINLKSEWL
ncbi:tetratricopeptide repeat-containing sensor histidine kinase [Flavobacterium sp. U410]